MQCQEVFIIKWTSQFPKIKTPLQQIKNVRGLSSLYSVPLFPLFPLRILLITTLEKRSEGRQIDTQK